MCFYPSAKCEPATRLTMPRTMTKWIINEKLISRTLLIYVFLSDPKDVSALSLTEKNANIVLCFKVLLRWRIHYPKHCCVILVFLLNKDSLSNSLASRWQAQGSCKIYLDQKFNEESWIFNLFFFFSATLLASFWPVSTLEMRTMKFHLQKPEKNEHDGELLKFLIILIIPLRSKMI